MSEELKWIFILWGLVCYLIGILTEKWVNE